MKSNPNGGEDLSPMVVIFRRVEGPIPPPFPNGKGAGRLMVVTSFQWKIFDLFEDGFGFSPLGETGEGFGVDPLRLRHLRQIRQGKFGMRIEQLDRRICPQGASRGETRRWALCYTLRKDARHRTNPRVYFHRSCSERNGSASNL